MGEKGSLTLILFGFLYSWLTSKLKVFWKCFETLLNKGKTEKTSLLFHNISPKKVTCKSSNPCTFKPRFRVLDPFFFWLTSNLILVGPLVWGFQQLLSVTTQPYIRIYLKEGISRRYNRVFFWQPVRKWNRNISFYKIFKHRTRLFSLNRGHAWEHPTTLQYPRRPQTHH